MAKVRGTNVWRERMGMITPKVSVGLRPGWGHTLEELAERFVVSVGWAKKISAQQRRSGRAERVPHHPGRKPRVGVETQKQVVAWVRAQPDLTLAELSARLHREASITLSQGRVWYLVRKRLGLRLRKKSRSTPPSATAKRFASAWHEEFAAKDRCHRAGENDLP